MLFCPPPPRADLPLLLWPVFFIAAAREDPYLKGRNFRKSVARGSERVVGLSKPVLRPASLRHRGGLSTSSGGLSPTRRTTADAEVERPQWDTADASAREQGVSYWGVKPLRFGDTLTCE